MQGVIIVIMHKGHCMEIKLYILSQLLTLSVHVCSHSSAKFYRQSKRHSMTTNLTKTQQFPRSTVQNDNFLELYELFSGISNIES